MKPAYLNNVTTEAVNYRRKVSLMPDGSFTYNVRPSRLKHLFKLLRYRDRAFLGNRW